MAKETTVISVIFDKTVYEKNVTLSSNVSTTLGTYWLGFSKI